jgi:hypothetical protein
MTLIGLTRQVSEHIKNHRKHMRYLQIVATGILIALCVIAVEIHGTKQEIHSQRPVSINEWNRARMAPSNSNAIMELQERVPIAEVLSVMGTVDVNVGNSVEVRTDYKSPLNVEIER